jgi:hypothetical protein
MCFSPSEKKRVYGPFSFMEMATGIVHLDMLQWFLIP